MNRSRPPSPSPSASSISARSSPVELRRLGFELHAHADDLGPAAQLGLDRGDDLGDAIEVALADVHQRQHRLVGEEELLAQQRPAASAVRSLR